MEDKIKSMKTISTLIDDIKINQVPNYIKQESLVIAYFYNEILCGKFLNGIFTFYDNKKLNEEYLKEMRIFNSEEELHIWRNNGSFKGRLKADGQSDKQEYCFDSNQILFGTLSEKLAGDFIKISEDRGTELILPDNGYNVDKGKNRIAVKVRNYISYTGNYLADIKDSRFVELIQVGG